MCIISLAELFIDIVINPTGAVLQHLVAFLMAAA